MDVRHKGLDTLLDAVALIAGSLRTACYRVELVGPDHRGGVVRLHKTIARLGIGDIVAVLPAKRGAEKLDWLSSVTAFVHASRYEGQPQAVFEAIARGAIPIVTHSCNMDKLIEDIGVGFAVDGNASAIAGALAKVMTATAFPDPKHLQAFFADYAEATVAARMITQLRAFVSEMRAS